MERDVLMELVGLIKRDIITVGKIIDDLLKSNESIFNYEGFHIILPFNEFSEILEDIFNPNGSTYNENDLNKLENLEYRLTLFRKIFETEKIITVGMINSYLSYSISSFQISELYYRFFYKVFCDFIRTKENVEGIFFKLLEQWKYAINAERVQIFLELKLDQGDFDSDINTDKKFQLIKKKFLKINESFTIKRAFWKAFLQYNIELTVLISKPSVKIEKFDYLGEFNKKYREFQGFLIALYLHNIKILNPIPIIILPWWMEPYKYIKRRKDIDTSHKKITKEVYQNALKVNSKLHQKKFFSDSCFPLYNSLFEFAFENQTIIKSIFDAHIMMEYLFAPGNEGELSYRIALNAALFLSHSIDDFKKNFYFFRSYV